MSILRWGTEECLAEKSPAEGGAELRGLTWK
jgi:hypothetical protein